jgi:hypothetical protein
MRQNIQGANQGCFLLMVGIYYFTNGRQYVKAGDHQRGFSATTEAYKVFESLRDELFMLLTSKLVVELCEMENYNNEVKKSFQSVVDHICRLPTFENVNVQLLFENFKQRLNLAKQVTSFNSDHYGTRECGESL